MKHRLRVRLVGLVAAGAVGFLAPLISIADEAAPAAATSPSELQSAEIIRGAYLAFVRDSIVPANPRAVAIGALATLESGSKLTLPEEFGSDAMKDAAWLAAHFKNTAPPWNVVNAMARSARIVHMALVTPERRRGLGALGSGEPLCSPGFSLHPLADGRLAVREVVPGASADRSGLRVGDVVLEVSGMPAVTADPFFLTLRPADTDVPLKIIRAGNPASEPMQLVLHLIRAEVSPIEARLLDDGNAHILVRWFSRSANPEHDTTVLFRRGLQAMLDRGARGLVLDLRSSLGGSGEENMASALFDGEIIYSMLDPAHPPAKPIPRDGDRIWPGLPVAVLQNHVTTSAGEDLALALRELGHAVIVGETSGGGLTAFDFVKLAEGYGVIIPAAVILGPVSGECPAGYAVMPDIAVSNPEIDELLAGRDRQLDAASAALVRNQE